MKSLFTLRRILLLIIILTAVLLLEKNRQSRTTDLVRDNAGSDIEFNNTNTDYILFQAVSKYMVTPFIKK